MYLKTSILVHHKYICLDSDFDKAVLYLSVVIKQC